MRVGKNRICFLYELSDIVRISGAPKRSILFWADRGALKADAGTDGAGSGKHRLFSKDEAVIACVLHGLASQSMSIGHLVRAAEALRSAIRWEKPRDIMNYALRGDGMNLLIVDRVGRGYFYSDKLTGKVSLEETMAELVERTQDEVCYVTVNLNAALRNAGFQLTW
jgi:hypothetical protein